jgi:hypothetical protein
VRAGARRVWGDFPIHEAAFLGGSHTLRGFSSQRYAGSATVYGGVDARIPVDTVNLGLVRGQLGVLGLADVGRVFHASDTSQALHHGLGGGLWFAFRVRSTVLGATVSYARGEKDRVYLDFGAPF